MTETTCCFTGNRPHKLPWGGDESAPDCCAFLIDLRTQASRLVLLGYTHFVCGMALGADMLFAETVLDLKKTFAHITLEAAVPCPEQPDKWPAEQKKRYRRLLEQCDCITVVSPRYTADCMMKRNRYMVDKSAVVLAYNRAKKGGTTGTIRYAVKTGKTVIKL